MKGQGKGSGWKGESRRHSLARKGIGTADGIIKTKKSDWQPRRTKESWKWKYFGSSEFIKKNLESFERDINQLGEEMIGEVKEYYANQKDEITNRYQNDFISYEADIKARIRNARENNDNEMFSKLIKELDEYKLQKTKDMQNELKDLSMRLKYLSEELQKDYEEKYEEIFEKYNNRLQSEGRIIIKDEADELFYSHFIILRNTLHSIKGGTNYQYLKDPEDISMKSGEKYFELLKKEEEKSYEDIWSD